MSLQFLTALKEDPRFHSKISKPSVSFHGTNLYLQGPLEEMTRPNLSEKLVDLMQGKTTGVLNVNDKKLAGMLKVRPKFKDETGALAQGG